MSSISRKLPRLRLDLVSYESLRQQLLRRDGRRCRVARCRILMGVPQPSGSGLRRKLDHTVRGMPRQNHAYVTPEQRAAILASAWT
jgi:hypothetical protein